MRKPTFFISSTIFDFKDLRSALKFYLEEQGCIVLASEFNDFIKPVDSHSYEACLSSIENCDYFILLIGSRIGGWFDAKERVSITQREYREAYELHRKGKLKILSFVRTQVWQVKEDRKEFQKYLEELEIAEEIRPKIVNYPTKFASDSAFIIDFINEVARNKETIDALNGRGTFPTGNWVHIFETFKDIVDAIQGQVFAGLSVQDTAIKRLLIMELREVVRNCLFKSKDRIYHPIFFKEQFDKECPIDQELKKSDFIEVKVRQWDWLASAAVQLLAVKIHPVMIQDALRGTVFLQFDLAAGAFKETTIYEALSLLNDEIRKFFEKNTTETLSVIFKHSPNNRAGNPAILRIKTLELVPFLFLCDRWINIIQLSSAIILHLEKGTPFEMPRIMSESPIIGMEEKLIEERLSQQDVDNYLCTIAGPTSGWTPTQG
jgi:uncharacterized protein DUF4062